MSIGRVAWRCDATERRADRAAAAAIPRPRRACARSARRCACGCCGCARSSRARTRSSPSCWASIPARCSITSARSCRPATSPPSPSGRARRARARSRIARPGCRGAPRCPEASPRAGRDVPAADRGARRRRARHHLARAQAQRRAQGRAREAALRARQRVQRARAGCRWRDLLAVHGLPPRRQPAEPSADSRRRERIVVTETMHRSRRCEPVLAAGPGPDQEASASRSFTRPPMRSSEFS